MRLLYNVNGLIHCEENEIKFREFAIETFQACIFQLGCVIKILLGEWIGLKLPYRIIYAKSLSEKNL